MAQELYVKIGEGSGDALFFFFSPSLPPAPSHNIGPWEGVLAETYPPRFNIVTWDNPIQLLAPKQSKVSKFILFLSWSLLQNTEWAL